MVTLQPSLEAALLSKQPGVGIDVAFRVERRDLSSGVLLVLEPWPASPCNNVAIEAVTQYLPR